MNVFKRFMVINTAEEGAALCDLIQGVVHGSEYWDIAETFGCEFTCDDTGEVICPDFSPMIGTWWVHFDFSWDRLGDSVTKYVLRINQEIQSASEIIEEYNTAKQYVIDNNHLYEAINHHMSRALENPLDMVNRNELLTYIDKFDRDKFFEMGKRRDLAAGDPNPYTDYTGLEDKWKYL